MAFSKEGLSGALWAGGHQPSLLNASPEQHKKIILGPGIKCWNTHWPCVSAVSIWFPLKNPEQRPYGRDWGEHTERERDREKEKRERERVREK